MHIIPILDGCFRHQARRFSNHNIKTGKVTLTKYHPPKYDDITGEVYDDKQVERQETYRLFRSVIGGTPKLFWAVDEKIAQNHINHLKKNIYLK